MIKMMTEFCFTHYPCRVCKSLITSKNEALRISPLSPLLTRNHAVVFHCTLLLFRLLEPRAISRRSGSFSLAYSKRGTDISGSSVLRRATEQASLPTARPAAPSLCNMTTGTLSS